MINHGKIWGTTSPIFNFNNVEIHRIVGKRGGKCSKHKHEHKYNMFFVESGELLIEVWKNDYDLKDETLLKAGQSCIVEPGEFHRFTVYGENTVVYEIYWVSINEKDIIREDHGTI